jgi:hypothetical protein
VLLIALMDIGGYGFALSSEDWNSCLFRRHPRV